MAVKQHVTRKPSRITKTSDIKVTDLITVENPISEANSDVEMAYSTFINARNGLSEAVKEQEKQSMDASKNTERRYRAYRLIVEQAFSEKEKIESQAFEAYRKSVLQANKVYRDKLDTLLVKCKSITDNAWEASLETFKENPDGKFKPVSGVWPKTKIILWNFAKQTRKFFNKIFRNTIYFFETRVNSLKTTSAQTSRLKLK